MSLTEILLLFIAAFQFVIMCWLAAIYGKVAGAIQRYELKRDRKD